MLASTGQAQTPPVLNITNGINQVGLNWSNPNSYFLLQSATNLTRPINWVVCGSGASGMANVQKSGPQMFFRTAQMVPLYQFAIFYNLDLEINPGAAMTVVGPVHSNGSIWATGAGSGTSRLVFSSTVDAVGTISNVPSPLDPQNVGRSGNVLYTFTDNNPLANYNPLTFAFGTNPSTDPTSFLAILQSPPPSLAPPNYTAAYSVTGLAYLQNAVDLIVTNAANGTNGTLGTNIMVYYQNPNNVPNYLIQVLPDVTSTNITGSGSSKATNIIYAYSYVTNVSFYDYREGKTVQAVQIDVAKLNSWLTNTSATGGIQYDNLNLGGGAGKGHHINSIYVFNNVTQTPSQLPAVRIVNGQKLPVNGLTVATPQPLYMLGNYNNTTNGSTFSLTVGDTTNTVPSALMCDAITILSGNWSDSFNPSTPLSSRTPADTVVNAAVYTGIVLSNGTHYSGGVENYFRLLENWAGNIVTWNGSMTALFPSQYATNFWQPTGNYYNAPTRRWGFDLNFTNLNKLPPLTPLVANFVTP
ncbi:MAG TPA: hypothetical protein VIK53_18680 [Verrucomicrobiae bacterium]